MIRKSFHLFIGIFCLGTILVSAQPVTATSYTLDPIAELGIKFWPQASMDWPDGRWIMDEAFGIYTDKVPLPHGLAPAFALFDLGSITIPVSSGTLILGIDYASWPPFLPGTLPITRDFALYDITDIGAIFPPSSSESYLDYYDRYLAVKNDMMTGAIYGQFSVTSSSQNLTLEIPLTDIAIYNINNSSESIIPLFAMGISTFENSFIGGDETLSFSHSQLNFTPVPEPSTIILFATGLIYLAGWGKRNFKRR